MYCMYCNIMYSQCIWFLTLSYADTTNVINIQLRLNSLSSSLCDLISLGPLLAGLGDLSARWRCWGDRDGEGDVDSFCCDVGISVCGRGTRGLCPRISKMASTVVHRFCSNVCIRLEI
jgi:hypothetical protein